jgi:hypothetical protein
MSESKGVGVDPVIWTAIAGAIVGVVGPIVTATAVLRSQRQTAQATDRREELRLKQEETLKKLDLENNKLEKRRDECIEAYRALVQATRDVNFRAPYEFSDLTEAYWNIELVSDSQPLITTAWKLVEVCIAARKVATDAYKENSDRDLAAVPEVVAAMQNNYQVRGEFMKLAKADLGEKSRLPVAVTTQKESSQRVIEEIDLQMNLLGPTYTKSVILSTIAYEELLAEKAELGLSQVNPNKVPPTVYGLGIRVVDEPGRNITVLAGM